MSTPKAWACSWHDAHLNGLDEADAEDCVHRPWVYVSCGILVKSNEAGITLAMDQGEDGKFRTRSFIPRAMVVDEWDMGAVRKKVKRKRREKTPAKEEPPK